MKSIIKRGISKLNSTVNKPQSTYLRNVFNKMYNRKVLVSYITAPFIEGVNDRHTNLVECYTACQIFDELEYNVDVIDYNKFENEIDFKSYDVVYGFGESFEQLFSNKEYSCFSHKIKKIIYGTGCDTAYSNRVSLERVNLFFKESNLLCISSARFAPLTWRCQIVFADLIIALGNQFVVDTYKLYNSNKVEPLKIFFKNIDLTKLHQKNIAVAKHNFIWWGSVGAIHKGLDLILQVFSKRKDINVFICGYRQESPFCDYFDDIVSKNKNIVDLGFVQIGSEKHVELLNSCAATIMPSASEGCAPGIVSACGNAGLIPIITKSCGIDLPEESNQFVLDELTAKCLEDKIDLFLSLDNNLIIDISEKLQYYFQTEYSFSGYKNKLKNLISSAI